MLLADRSRLEAAPPRRLSGLPELEPALLEWVQIKYLGTAEDLHRYLASDVSRTPDEAASLVRCS